MPWRPHGKARVDANNPEAFAVCDRCGIWHNHNRLSFQYEWGGPNLINRQMLVCEKCLDVPQDQLRTIVLPPDPVPIQNPRPEYFEQDFYTFLIGQDGSYLIGQNTDYILSNNSLPPPE